MTEEPRILPCPFCGGKASRWHRTTVEIGGKTYPGHIFLTGCDNAGCGVLPSATQLSQEYADEAWNTRTPAIAKGAAYGDSVGVEWQTTDSAPDGIKVLTVCKAFGGNFFEPEIAYRNGAYWFYAPGERHFGTPDLWAHIPTPPQAATDEG